MSDQASTDSTLLEATARAICAACGDRPDHKGDCRGKDFRWQDYREIAQAAFNAIRPTHVIVPRVTE